MKNTKFIIFLLLFISCNNRYNESNSNSGSNLKNKNIMEKISKNDFFKVIKGFNDDYIKFSNQIFYTETDGYEYFYENEGVKGYRSIDDSLRIKFIDSCLYNESFQKLFTTDFISRILDTRKLNKDPVTLGYMLTKHNVGKSLLSILSREGNINLGIEENFENNSGDISNEDYKQYHLEKIHIVNDTIVAYKNSDIELSLEENLDRLYFIFKRINKNSKWLLDDIIVCTKEDEKSFDEKLIGESKPIEYYHPKVLDYEEQN